MAITQVTQKLKTADTTVIIDLAMLKDDSTTPPTYYFIHARKSIQRAKTTSRVTSAGTVTAGAVSVSFANSGSVNASVDGVTMKPGEGWDYPYAGGDTYPAIAYNPGSGGELIIIEVR